MSICITLRYITLHDVALPHTKSLAYPKMTYAMAELFSDTHATAEIATVDAGAFLSLARAAPPVAFGVVLMRVAEVRSQRRRVSAPGEIVFSQRRRVTVARCCRARRGGSQ